MSEMIHNVKLMLMRLLHNYRALSSICSIEEQTITSSDLIQQDIDINEPVGNLKKLLEPRVQISLDAYEICLQDIQVRMALVQSVL